MLHLWIYHYVQLFFKHDSIDVGDYLQYISENLRCLEFLKGSGLNRKWRTVKQNWNPSKPYTQRQPSKAAIMQGEKNIFQNRINFHHSPKLPISTTGKSSMIHSYYSQMRYFDQNASMGTSILGNDKTM